MLDDDLLSRVEELIELTGAGDARQGFDLEQICYPEQRQFVESRAKRKLLRKTRRSGGTVALAAWYLDGIITPPFANELYVTNTLKNAKRMVWPTLKKLNAQYELGGIPNETEGSLRFPQLPNEPVIYLGGAKDADEVEKIRGIEGGIKRAGVDEVQSIRASILKTLIDDVIEPSLFDYDGELAMVGTPGPVLAGYFYENDEGKDRDAWTHFYLSMVRNPFLEKKSGKPAAQLLRELMERRKWTADNPTYRREYLGEWVTDADALALHYLAARNACAWSAEPVRGWQYVVAFDIGFDDADAIAVLGWAPHERKLRLVKELVRTKQGITELGNQLRAVYDAYRPIRLVGDMGALGKKIGEELNSRWGLPVEAADKQRKAEHVALLDDALRTGAFLAPPDSRFAEDCAIVQWDSDAKAKGRLEFDDSYHSDIIDAVLYGFRAAYHWAEKAAPPPIVTDIDRHRAEVRAMLEEARQRDEETNPERDLGWG